MQLTPRQQQILEFIEQRMRADGLPPTRAEIVKHFGFASPNAAQCHLQALAAHGAIELRPGMARGIVLPANSSESSQQHGTRPALTLPLIGRVAAGSPVLALENREKDICVDAGLFSPRPDYLLRVQGDSMTGAGIEDGDLLAVSRTPEARSGQIVVARIDHEVTVKRFLRSRQGIVLQPENPDHDPLHITPGTDFAIEGLVVGKIRAFTQR